MRTRAHAHAQRSVRVRTHAHACSTRTARAPRAHDAHTHACRARTCAHAHAPTAKDYATDSTLRGLAATHGGGLATGDPHWPYCAYHDAKALSSLFQRAGFLIGTRTRAHASTRARTRHASAHAKHHARAEHTHARTATRARARTYARTHRRGASASWHNPQRKTAPRGLRPLAGTTVNNLRQRGATRVPDAFYWLGRCLFHVGPRQQPARQHGLSTPSAQSTPEYPGRSPEYHLRALCSLRRGSAPHPLSTRRHCDCSVPSTAPHLRRDFS
jgi:hypothetical protein